MVVFTKQREKAMITGNIFDIWPIERMRPTLNIPSTWENVQQFAIWYMNARMPFLIPFDAEVFRTDDATSITVFRKSDFQVELYLHSPGYAIKPHCHPDVDVVTMTLGGGKNCGEAHPVHGTGVNIGRMNFTPAGEYHQSTNTDHDGFAVLAFQHWKNGLVKRKASAAVQWEGVTAGPIHDALIATRE